MAPRAGRVLGLLSAVLLLAADALARTGTINDVEHIVVFMQENRAYDHYYGKLRGVRGFNDRAAPPLPDGKPIFFQPLHGGDYMLPFHVEFDKTSGSCMPAPEMNYPTDILMWNHGRFDAWNTAREPGFGMGYFERGDLPYYYALCDAFTVGDQYFQSTFTQTNPNRLHLFSGSNGLSVGEKATLDNTEPTPGFGWPTLAETLENASISWKLYQQHDNFDDNGFAWFEAFKAAKPGSPLYDRGMQRATDLVAEFESDLRANTLPQVSWIVAPTHLSEHATNHPADGEDLTARLLKVLSSYPEVYAKTAFILNYDEGGQFVDHHWSPTPPVSEGDGASTVSTKGEVTELRLPIGLGFRVPLVVVSPFSRGNFVTSEVLDHTSVVKFIEKRFGVKCPNISPWRRAVTGDLTSAFDFEHPDFSWPTLPDTSSYVNQSASQCEHLPAPTIPTQQSMPAQEPGTRLARPLPYTLDVAFAPAGHRHVTLSMNNTGRLGAVFYVYNLADTKVAPLKFTVEHGKALSWTWEHDGFLSLSLHGPNGFVRRFATSGKEATPPLSLAYVVGGDGAAAIEFTLPSTAAEGAVYTVVDKAYKLGGPWTLPAAAARGSSNGRSVRVPLTASHHWYDFHVTSSTDERFEQHAMGHVENGRPSTSDPAMGAGVPSAVPQRSPAHPYPDLAPQYLFPRQGGVANATHKDAVPRPTAEQRYGAPGLRREL